MWIFSTLGFYSVVQEREDKECVRVSASCQRDLERLLALKPEDTALLKIIHLSAADQAYQVTMTKELWAKLSADLFNDITYTDFEKKCQRVFPSEYSRIGALVTIEQVMRHLSNELNASAHTYVMPQRMASMADLSSGG